MGYNNLLFDKMTNLSFTDASLVGENNNYIFLIMSKLSEKALMTALRRRVPTPLPPPSVRKLDMQHPTPPQATQSSSQEAGRLHQKKRKFRCTRTRNVWNKVPQNHPLYSGTGPSTSSHVGALPPLRRAPKRPRECVVKIFRPWTDEKFFFVKSPKPLLEAASGRRVIKQKWQK
ncbi:unnamed protein product [Trichogramma brassicae]|uniref:Uncharacterized protein n=1 Tax=Trichogramma brassicae TaxID=86971 RepID=A0A6H5IUC7_9HYME|nr:unnamed protein product [Trichogramma brassicae]